MNEKSQPFFQKYKSDFILIAIVLVIGFTALLIQRVMQKTGRTVAVILSGNEIERFSLDADMEYKIELKDGGGYNILVIKDGEAYVSEATCSEQICVKHNAISSTGETIVCLPHKLTIEIK
ncbi:MAG: NusG domain II-containing protein [Clostridium sp.]|nr:NusG domain II-containing protein [Clostridium sp.]MCM1398290.1 NusG domain II-containing protein [Clostridium sp.]MCM1459046.1 NusG domain II-containing protein [Bacteroides sp.]